MLANYLKITGRNLVRHRGYSLINILGLAVGLSCCILILLLIQAEMSFDRFHKNGDHIYRIVQEWNYEGKIRFSPTTPAPLAPALADECPDVEQVVRFGSGPGDIVLLGEKQYRNIRFGLVDANVFDVFTIPLLKGDPQSALSDRNAVVISEELAQKIGGDNDPLGAILKIGDDEYQRDYQVTGVFKKIPANSWLQFDCLASFQVNYFKANEGNLTWGAHNYSTFVLLPEAYAPENLAAKLAEVVGKYQPDQNRLKTTYHLQPLTKMHVDLNPANRLPTDKNSAHLYIFAGVALLILLIACLNFMNLATARAFTREKEVGLRKVVGAGRLQLIRHFLGESVALSLLAFLLSIPLVEILLPLFNHYVGKELAFLHHGNLVFLMGALFLALFTGVLAGFYPALFLSSFKPITTIKGSFFAGKRGHARPRRILVVTQFAISIIFIVCTLVMHDQLRYIKNKNLGYAQDHLLVIPIHDPHVKPKVELYKTEILRHSHIISATATAYLPSRQGYFQNVEFRNAPEGSPDYLSWIPVDYDFVKTMGLEIIRGRNFSPDFSTDAGTAYILNESAVQSIGWTQPIGEQMNVVAWGPVVGVIKDFHFESLHHQIQPMALCIYPDIFQHLLVRISPDDISGSLHVLKDRWAALFPGEPFEYSFFDADFEQVYKNEMRMGSIFNFVAALALFVACLGLFGLVTFSADRRVKEIGIRKVLGASVPGVLVLLIKDFSQWLLMAAVVASPIVWYAMSKWLQNFAYRIDLTLWPFLLAGLIALLIALLTVSWQAVRAATTNPVESLRYE